MMPETVTQPTVPSPTKMFIARICLLLLLGMIFAALFGDFVVWAIFGTKFILSPRFHNLLPMFSGGTIILLFLFMAQAQKDWKQGKPHFALLGLLVLTAGVIPLAPIAARTLFFTATVGMTVFNKPAMFPTMLLLVTVAACKVKTLYSLWKLGHPAFEAQDQRRIVISK